MMGVEHVIPKPRGVFFIGLMLFATQVTALPFASIDARSAALGGIGVATGTRAAMLNNPALLATHDEEYDAYAALPAQFEVIRDPTDFSSGFDQLSTAAQSMQTSNTPANQQVVADALANLQGDDYSKAKGRMALVAIPSVVLGGAAYILSYDYHTMRADIQNEDLASNPANYQSRLQHRGVSVVENGVTVAKLVDVPWLGMYNVMVGLTGKLLLTEGYGYDEAINIASLSLDEAQADRSSVFQLDFGIVKEYGIWKYGFVIRNLLGGSVDYGATGESLSLGPQLRVGVAYKSRKNLVEMDVDAIKNEGVGYNSDTMMLSSGWEHQLKPNFSTRLGYQQNLAGLKESTASAGLGFELWGVVLDLALTRTADATGAFVQLGYQF